MSREAAMNAIPPAHRATVPGTGFWLFLFLVAVYLLSFSGVFHSIDEVSTAAMTESLVKHGQVNTDQIVWSQNWTPSQGQYGPDGHLYSKKGVGLALVGAPFYWLALHLPGAGAVQTLMLTNALVTALTGWLVYRSVLQLRYGSSVAVLTALGFGLGTMAWPYAKYFFGGPATALGLMAGLWGLLVLAHTGRARYGLLAGAGLGLALLTRPASGSLWPLFLVYGFWILVVRRGQTLASSGPQAGKTMPRSGSLWAAVAFLLPLAAAILGLALYNMVRGGSPLDMGYTSSETFSTPLGLGLRGLLISPGKSLFLFSPLLLLALFGIPGLFRRDWPTASLCLGVALIYTVLHAAWYMWWGGWSWGPRFLVPILPFLSLFLAPVVDWVLQPSPSERARTELARTGPARPWARVLLAIAFILGVGVQLLGVLVDFNQYLLLLYGQGVDSAEVNFRLDLSPHLGHWKLLRDGVWDLAWRLGPGQGVDLAKLLWPLALFATVSIGWTILFLAGRGRVGPLRWRERLGRWFLAAAVLVLVGVSVVTLTRLPHESDDWQAGSQALSAVLEEAARPGDVLIVDLLPYAPHLELATSFMERYKASPPYWGWAREEPVSAGRGALLDQLGQEFARLWLALDTTPEADPASTTERWLDERAYRVEGQWLSPALRLVRYQLPPDGPDSIPPAPVNLRLGDRIWLQEYTIACAAPCRSATTPQLRPGDVLELALFWRAEGPPEEDYRVFVQLLDHEGRLRAQIDRAPQAGFRPTPGWQPGEVVRDNYGLEMPSDLPPGDYQVITGLYSPASTQRLDVSSAEGVLLGDHVSLLSVALTAEGGP